MTVARRNIEIKCRCSNLDSVLQKARALGAADQGVLRQKDTFFAAPRARLKLRELGDRAELISYRRGDSSEARASDYVVLPIPDPQVTIALLEHALGSCGVVRKVRHLFLLRHTRIHLDEVEGLGTFVELETVLSDLPEEEGRWELAEIALGLGLNTEDYVAVPYVEMSR